tara:strand:- start:85 stop:1197 length:1113 start_codon:yes stop_codon:yes gene_type:complete
MSKYSLNHSKSISHLGSNKSHSLLNVKTSRVSQLIENNRTLSLSPIRRRKSSGRKISDTIPEPPRRACCSHFQQACYFLCENFCEKIKGDMLLGTKPLNNAIIPTNNCIESQTPFQFSEVTDEEKKESVLTDPRFGMFSLFKYHLHKGYLNKKLQKGDVYCFNIFSLFFALPILVFFSQWIMYLALIFHEKRQYDGNICPGVAPIEQKVMMAGISIIYFVRSFFIWDSFTNRTRLQKMNPGGSISVIFDTYQEFGFNLIVYCANLWIVFVDNDLLNMILNSLAMEFLMNLDNEFEEMYFKFLPQCAIDVYDNIFVTVEENNKIVKEKREKYCCFNCLSLFTRVPFRLLVLLLFLFPPFCLFMIFFGSICK